MSTPGATFSNPSTPSRRYTPATGSAGYTSAASKRRRGRLLLLLGLLALVVLLTVIIVPPSVVLTRKNKNNVAEGQQVVTTVVDGKTETRTLDGVVATRTRLTTLANGQASTVTSFVALPDVTTEVATVTFTAGGGQVGTRTVTLTSLDIVTVLGYVSFPPLLGFLRCADPLATQSDAYICFSVDHDASFDDEYKRELDFGIEHFEQRLVFVDPSALFLPHNFLLARLYNDHNVQRVPLLFVFGSLDIRFALEHRPANLFKHHDSSNYVPSPDDFWELLVEQYKPVVYDAAGYSTSASTSRSSSTTLPPTSTPGSSTSSSSTTRSTSSRSSSSTPGSTTAGTSSRDVYHLDYPSALLLFSDKHLPFLPHQLTSRHMHLYEPAARMRLRLARVAQPFSLVYHNSAAHDEPLRLVPIEFEQLSLVDRQLFILEPLVVRLLLVSYAAADELELIESSYIHPYHE
uniref:FGENESH: predicted gene_6.188 protein n=1 Tax=Rhodotorula toruloides TaxID=5286 RepID=A0A0K3CFW7_RHOTO